MTLVQIVVVIKKSIVHATRPNQKKTQTKRNMTPDIQRALIQTPKEVKNKK